MTEILIYARTTFRGFFTVDGKEGKKWLEIAEGTTGIASDPDPESGKHRIVIFEHELDGRRMSVTAPVALMQRDLGKTDHVWHENFIPDQR